LGEYVNLFTSSFILSLSFWGAWWSLFSYFGYFYSYLFSSFYLWQLNPIFKVHHIVVSLQL
jgi:hypothetical protein